MVTSYEYNHFSPSKGHLMKRFHCFSFIARELMPLLELQRIWEVRRSRRVFFSWLSVRRRLQVLFRDANLNRKFDHLGQMLIDGKC